MTITNLPISILVALAIVLACFLPLLHRRAKPKPSEPVRVTPFPDGSCRCAYVEDILCPLHGKAFSVFSLEEREARAALKGTK